MLSSTSSMRQLSLSLYNASISTSRNQRWLSTSIKSLNQSKDNNTTKESEASQSSKSESTGSELESASSSSSPSPSSTRDSSPSKPNSKDSSQSKKSLSSIQPIEFKPSDLSTFPSFIHRTSPIYDSVKTIYSPTTPNLPYPSSVTFINDSDTRLFKPSPPSSESLIRSSGGSSSGTSGSDSDGAEYLSSITSLSVREINNLHRHAIAIKRVVRMSGKGKMARMSALVVVGNGKGLVGFGQGKDTNAGKAARKAFQQGVKSMDYVRRFENRTVEYEIEGKWSATRVILRPRPAGFGLRVPPAIHAVARSAGISDLSASIRGSTNPTSVVRATLQALWPGSSPLGLGDGLGGKAKRTDKGSGPRTREEIMRERGRRLEEVRLV